MRVPIGRCDDCTLAAMLISTTVTAPSGDRRADVIERADGLFEVMVFQRIHEHVPEFGVDEDVWVETGRDEILTDTYERAGTTFSENQPRRAGWYYPPKRPPGWSRWPEPLRQ